MNTVELRASNPAHVPDAQVSALHRNLTSAPVLVRSTVWNLIGQIAPMFVAVVAIPPLIRELGKDRFGVLTIAWMVVGYFSLFDLGLGRALTNLVAQALACDDHDRLPALIWTANVVMLLLGMVGAVVFAVASPWVVHTVLKIPPALQQEVVFSFFVLSASIPFSISTAGLRGVMEAKQRFGSINAVRVPMGVATFLAPLCVLPFSHSLVAVVLVLTVARVIFWLAFLLLVLREIPDLRRGVRFRRQLLPELLSFGGWMTVSNIVSPVMSSLDRFLIGAILSLPAVAYYATPYEVSTKLLVISASIVGVLFPAFSTALAGDPARAAMLFRRAVKYISLALAPVVFLVLVFAREGLTLWLGPDFAAHSTAVLQWITVGVFINSLAFVPFAFVQGAGRPDITGKLHLVELPLYVIAVLGLTYRFGIVGTAIAWTLRITADCVLLFWFASRVGSERMWKEVWSVVCFALIALALPLAAFHGLPLKLLIAVLVLGIFVLLSWTGALSGAERGAMTKLLRFEVAVESQRRKLSAREQCN